MFESKSCHWVHRLVERWTAQAKDRGHRALEMYEKDLTIDNNHRRALSHVANAFYDEGIAAVKRAKSHGRDRRSGETKDPGPSDGSFGESI